MWALGIDMGYMWLVSGYIWALCGVKIWPGGPGPHLAHKNVYKNVCQRTGGLYTDYLMYMRDREFPKGISIQGKMIILRESTVPLGCPEGNLNPVTLLCGVLVLGVL